jgi:trimeric autotransporter adhesin
MSKGRFTLLVAVIALSLTSVAYAATGSFSSSSSGTALTVTNSSTGKAISAAAKTGYAGLFKHTAATGTTAALQGQTASASSGAAGVVGAATATTGSEYGVKGTAKSPNAVGVYGAHTAVTGTKPGVYGTSASGDSNAVAVLGKITDTSPGDSSAAIRGINAGTATSGMGVWGSHAGSGWGVFGTAAGSGIGVVGSSPTGYGVDGYGAVGVYGESLDGYGVYGAHYAATGTQPGVFGSTGSTAASAVGVLGTVSPTAPGGFSAGVRGVNNGTGGNGVGVYGSHDGGGYGVYGTSPTGLGVVGNTTSGYAGYFNGNTHVVGNLSITGSISKGSGTFKIDHPLDPANKYLYHSFVESPDMMNIYNGNATLNSNGEVWVDLPDWFTALNRDFRYQLTPIGAPGPNLYVAVPVANNRFKIGGGTPAGQVSWQVTGIRQDAFANANRVQVEVNKTGADKGKYLYPELFGKPLSMGIFARWERQGK